MNRFPGRFRGTAAAAAMVSALLMPAAANASQDYVVMLSPTADHTCAATIEAVSAAYSLAPKYTYTSAICGFSASISKRTVEQVRLDSRVTSVEVDQTAGKF